MSDRRTRLAVLGSPIAHSKSPAIQRAAFSVLGVDWSYDAIEMTGDGLGAFLADRDGSWRGLSLTMPLKRDVLPMLSRRHPTVDLVGGANTVLLTDDGPVGFNTDVDGAVAALQSVGVASLNSVLLLGSGATAASVLAAVARLGASEVDVAARTPANAAPLVDLGDRLGVTVHVGAWDAPADPDRAPDLVVSTVPGGATGQSFSEEIRRGAVLFEVAYDPWPTELVSQWHEAGGTVVSGLELLLRQAVGQIRIWVSGDPGTELPSEPAVLSAMRAAVD